MNDKSYDFDIESFTQALASTAPAPGGGGAAALIGSLGAALCHMAGALTSGKKKYAAYEEDIQRMLCEAEELRLEFLDLIRADAEGFLPLAELYSQSKDSPGYAEKLTEATLQACRAPYSMVKLSVKLIVLCREMGDKCSRLLLSDAGCAASAAGAALECAAMNLLVNTRALPDNEEAQTMQAQVIELLEAFLPLAREISASVTKELSGRENG